MSDNYGGGDRRGPKDRSPIPEKPRAGLGFFGRDSQSPPYQLRGLDSGSARALYKLLSSGARGGTQAAKHFLAFYRRQVAFSGIQKLWPHFSRENILKHHF